MPNKMQVCFILFAAFNLSLEFNLAKHRELYNLLYSTYTSILIVGWGAMRRGWKSEDGYPKYLNPFSCESDSLLS